MEFNQWLDTFVEEKGLDLDQTFTVTDGDLTHIFSLGAVIGDLKELGPSMKAQIKTTLVRIDFCNGDALHYFKYLANGLVKYGMPE